MSTRLVPRAKAVRADKHTMTHHKYLSKDTLREVSYADYGSEDTTRFMCVFSPAIVPVSMSVTCALACVCVCTDSVCGLTMYTSVEGYLTVSRLR